jgi:hypothetical protein
MIRIEIPGCPRSGWNCWINSTMQSHGPVTFEMPEMHIEKIASYWKHQADLARGYTKNPDELKKQLEILQQWEHTTENLVELVCRDS